MNVALLRYKTFALTLLLCIPIMDIHAEERFPNYVTKHYSVTPPSPEVAKMMSYADIPVSYVNGIPQIEIPLYTVKEGSLSLPIFLSYRGGGIKRHEHTGIISKGWTLMAGMTISRNVYGLPDECNKNQSRPNWLRGFFMLSQSDKALRSQIIDQLEFFDPSELNPSNVISSGVCSNYESGYVDFASDVYKFYGQGMSGTFMFDENRRPIVSTQSPIKFQTTSWQQANYTFIDKDGTTYAFGFEGVETTETKINAEGYNINSDDDINPEKLRYASAWHITKMKSIYNDSIVFEYSEPVYHIDYLEPSQYYSYYYAETYCYLTDRTHLNINEIGHNERYLTAIKSKAATVRFHYDNDMRLLNAISVHRNDGYDTQILKYTISRDSEGNMIAINQITAYESQIIYGFSYLPGICNTNSSLAIDHWGYCNGANGNNTILPEIMGMDFIPYFRADREPHTQYAQQGILSQIRYPMGGTTTLSWEQNDYSYIRGEGRLLSANSTTTTVKDTVQLRGTKINEKLTTEIYSMKRGDSFSIDLSKYLEPIMNSGSVFQLEFGNEYNDITHYDTHPRIDIYRNGVVYKTYYIDRTNSQSLKWIDTDSADYQIKLVNPRSFLGMSEIDINAFWGDNPTAAYENYGYITIIINKKVTMTDGNLKKPWGGLRISRIQSNPNGGISIAKNFSYKKIINGKEYSSGVIHKPVYNSYQGYAYYNDGGIGYRYTNMYGITSNGVMSSTDGEIGVEYGEVWETIEGPENVKVGYFYDVNTADVEHCAFSNFVPAGLKTLTSNGFKRCLLQKKLYSRKHKGSQSIYKRETYDYSIIEGPDGYTFTGPLFPLCDFSEIAYSDGKGDLLHKSYTINQFNLIPFNRRIRSELIEEFDLENNVCSERSVEYSYYGDGQYESNPWNSFVRTKSYLNSRNDRVTEYYTYQNVNGYCIDKKELEVIVVGDTILSARRYIYGSNHKLAATYIGCVGERFSESFSIPSNIRQHVNYPLIDKLEYSYKYDSQGNIVEIRYNNYILASFLWGYKNQHPIVEAKNIAYEDLFAIASGYGYTEGIYLSDMHLFVDAIRKDNRLKDKEVITYTYHWLLGMATATDSRGVTTTYTIDDFGRLSGIKDNNGYFIKKYTYKYNGL